MNSKKFKTVAHLLIVVCLVAFASCNKKDKRDFFRIKIDSITFEGVKIDSEVIDVARVYVDDEVVIKLHGYIGPNKCYVHAEPPAIYVDFNANRISFDARGEKINTDTCIWGEESFLDYEVILIFKDPDTSQPRPGVWTFYDFNNPDVQLLEIEVRE